MPGKPAPEGARAFFIAGPGACRAEMKKGTDVAIDAFGNAGRFQRGVLTYLGARISSMMLLKSSTSSKLRYTLAKRM